MRIRGRLSTYYAERSYGIISTDSEFRFEKFFLHASKVRSGHPRFDAMCEFDVSPVLSGRFRSAIDVDIADVEPASQGAQLLGGKQ